MMKDPCPICGGARIIRLPVRQPMSVLRPPFDPMQPTESARTFPCPECSKIVPLDRIAIIETSALFDSRLDDPEFERWAQRRVASQFADMLLAGGFIGFSQRRENPAQCTMERVATVGVVARNVVATLDLRIAERQALVARRAAEIAVAGIQNWGSSYGSREVPKDIAEQEIRRAIDMAAAEQATGQSAQRQKRAADPKTGDPP